MADMPRPQRPGAPRPDAPRQGSSRPGAPRAGGQAGRRPAPKAKPTPWFVWVGLVVSPIILLGLIFMNMGGSAPEAKPEKPVVIDENLKMKDLEKRVGPLVKSGQKAAELIRAESPTAKKQVEQLVAQIDAWVNEFEAIMRPKRDAEDNLPPELRGYQRMRTQVNQLRSDILKQSGF